VSFAAINLCVASQRVFVIVVVIISLSTQSGNFLIHPRINCVAECRKDSNANKLVSYLINNDTNRKIRMYQNLRRTINMEKPSS
jgi:hypothetical protein